MTPPTVEGKSLIESRGGPIWTQHLSFFVYWGVSLAGPAAKQGPDFAKWASEYSLGP